MDFLSKPSFLRRPYGYSRLKDTGENSPKSTVLNLQNTRASRLVKTTFVVTSYNMQFEGKNREEIEED